MRAHIESVGHCSKMTKALVRKTFLVIHSVQSFRQEVEHLVRPQAAQGSRKNIADYGSNKTKSKGLEIWACVERMRISWCVSLYGRVSVCICVAMCVYLYHCICSYVTI